MRRARGATPSCPARSGRCVDVVILCQPPGVECKGCAEKTELVKRVRETMHLPLKPEEPTGNLFGDGKQTEEIASPIASANTVTKCDEMEVASLVRATLHYVQTTA